MLTLPLVPTDDDAAPAFRDAAGCAQWLKQLQLTNLQLAHSQLLAQLDELNRYPVRAQQRFDTLEQLRDTVHHVQTDYAQRLVSKPLPLNENELLVFVAIVRLWQTMALGYRRCLQAYIDGDSRLAQSGALLCQRCLVYVGQGLLEHLRSGYEFDPRQWQHLHTLYAFSEQQGWQLREIPDPLNGDRRASSCHDAYLKTLLACYAHPAELSRPQLQRLDYWLAQWGNEAALERGYTSSKGDAQPLAVDLGSGHGLRSVMLVTQHGNMRYLAMVPFSKLLRVKTILLQQGQTPQQLGLGEYARDDCIELLTFLHQCWCENRNIRSRARTQVEKRAQVCYQPGNIHAHLSGRAQDDGAPAETWLARNENIAGAQLGCTDAPRGRLRHNQLIALRFDDSANFILAATAWVSVTRSGSLHIGVRYLPGVPAAIELHPGNADLSLSRNPVAALLLQAVPGQSVPPSLIVPRDWFQPGRAVTILNKAGDKQLVRLGFSVERGFDYERVSYSLLQP
jgi:hypothetical protein